jgi:hypothetical protein
MAGTGPSTWGLRRGRGAAECLKAKAHQKWSLYRPSALLRAGDGQQDGQRGKLDGITAGGIGGLRASAGGGTFGASTRQQRSERWRGTKIPLRGGYGLLGPRRSAGSIKRCQDDVWGRKPGDTEAARAVCDFVGFLILAERTPLIPGGGIANCGRGGIEPA